MPSPLNDDWLPLAWEDAKFILSVMLLIALVWGFVLVWVLE